MRVSVIDYHTPESGIYDRRVTQVMPRGARNRSGGARGAAARSSRESGRRTTAASERDSTVQLGSQRPVQGSAPSREFGDTAIKSRGFSGTKSFLFPLIKLVCYPVHVSRVLHTGLAVRGDGSGTVSAQFLRKNEPCRLLMRARRLFPPLVPRP